MKDVLPTDSEIKSFSNERNKTKSHESVTEKMLSSSAMPKDLSNTFKEVNSKILVGKDSDSVVEKEVSEISALDLLRSHAKN